MTSSDIIKHLKEYGESAPLAIRLGEEIFDIKDIKLELDEFGQPYFVSIEGHVPDDFKVMREKAWMYDGLNK